MLKITTSWDDGDILDMRVSKLLSRYGLTGTFYVTKQYRPERLSEKDIRALHVAHEVGAHTFTHPDLCTLSQEVKRDEIAGSKKWLETIIGAEVNMFCYPKGLYDDATKATVREAGFHGARTTVLGSVANLTNPFEMHTTLQVYPFPFRKSNTNEYYAKKFLQPFMQRSPALWQLGVPLLSMRSWLTMAKAAFDIALEQDGVFHLWGHSWEIEKYGMWKELEQFFAHIARRNDCVYLTNGDLVRK